MADATASKSAPAPGQPKRRPAGRVPFGTALSARRQVAVLGLGRFGASVARELTRLGHDVLGLDANEKLVQDLSTEVAHAVQVDITDGDALRELGLQSFDAAIVAISS